MLFYCLFVIIAMVIGSGDRPLLSLNADTFDKRKLLKLSYIIAATSFFLILVNVIFVTPNIRNFYNFVTVFVVNNLNIFFYGIMFISLVNVYCISKKNKYVKLPYFYIVFAILGFLVWDTFAPYIQMVTEYFLYPRLNYVDLACVFLGTFTYYLFLKKFLKNKGVQPLENENEDKPLS